MPAVADLTAVIGCGNANRSDDAAGVAVIRALARRPELAGRSDVKLLDAGTDGMAVMFAARGCRRLVIVDACRTGAPAGAIFEVPAEEVAAPHQAGLTLHDFRWDHALHAGRRMYGDDFPAEVTVLLVEAASLELGLELSPEVARAVDRVVDRVVDLVVDRVGAPLAARPEAAP